MRAVVIEDSRLARQGLIRMLEQHPAITVVGQAEHPQEAREVIAAERPDLLFLDIHMPGESGFDLLESLDYTPRIIFTTAYARYAVQSFEHNTVDYLVKPISQERLASAIRKLGAGQADEAGSALAEPPLDINSRIFVKDNDRCFLIPLRRIQYVESCRNYVRIAFMDDAPGRTPGMAHAFVKKPLNLVEERLPAACFFRASRQFVVNLNAIASIDVAVNDGYELTMHDRKVIEVSRRSAARLKDMLSL